MSRHIRLGLVGNTDNRRIRDFADRWRALGQPAPTLIDYRSLPESAPDVDALRIDSPGENSELATHLIALGGGPQNAVLDHGEVAYLREFHVGYCTLLKRIAGWQVPTINAPDAIAAMFDKWQSHQRFVAAGVSRPPATLAPGSYAEWRRGMAAQGRVFLKPLHGSSSSGVCALRWTKAAQQLKSPIKIENGRLYNSLRVRSYETWQEIEFILSRLLPQGMICETWIPKLSLAEGAVDLRILVIAGEARHAVVRQSRSPMTNLHLGNRRISPQAVADHLDGASRLAERAAACFGGCLYAGVDVLLDAKGHAFIGEINAFGDLLPGLTDRGDDAYTAIARAYLARANTASARGGGSAQP